MACGRDTSERGRGVTCGACAARSRSTKGQQRPRSFSRTTSRDTTRWWVGEDDGDTIAYDAGSLRMDIKHPGYYWWTGHELDDPRTALAIHGAVQVEGSDGAAGWVCATADDSLLVGVIGSAGWELAEVTKESWSTLGKGPVPSTATSSATSASTVAMDCDGAPSGYRAACGSMAPRSPIRVYDQAPWTRVGPFAQAGSAVQACFDDLVVLGSKAVEPDKA